MMSAILSFSKLSTKVSNNNNQQQQHQQQGEESQKRRPKRRQRTTIRVVSNQSSTTKNNSNMMIITSGIILALLQGMASTSLFSISPITLVQAVLEQPKITSNMPNNIRSRIVQVSTVRNTHNHKRRHLQEQEEQKQREDQQQQQQVNGAIKMESTNNEQSVIESQTVPFKNSLNADNFVKEELAIEKVEQKQMTTPQTAIIHIGPHKTGSTTIQSYLRNYVTDLEINDNYILPGDWNNRPKGAINMMNLVKCFLYNNQRLGSDFESSIDNLCDTQSYNDIQIIGAEKKANLLLSAESFSYANVDIKSVYYKINQYYTDDNIRIVLYYRRFYDWLISYWNQMNKVLPYDQRVTFVQYLENSNLIDTMYYTGPYFYGVTQRWEEYFSNVIKFNLYNLPESNDSTATFLCNGLVYANNTCTKHKNRPPAQKKKHINESPDLVYDDLFFSAIKLLKLDFTSTIGTDDPRSSTKPNEIRNKIIYKIQDYQETVLQLKSYNFNYKICPSNSIQQMLLERTKQTERIYFTEYYNTVGENEINKKFTEFQETKLCTINTDAVIQNSTIWQDFFHQLEKDQFLNT